MRWPCDSAIATTPNLAAEPTCSNHSPQHMGIIEIYGNPGAVTHGIDQRPRLPLVEALEYSLVTREIYDLGVLILDTDSTDGRRACWAGGYRFPGCAAV